MNIDVDIAIELIQKHSNKNNDVLNFQPPAS